MLLRVFLTLAAVTLSTPQWSSAQDLHDPASPALLKSTESGADSPASEDQASASATPSEPLASPRGPVTFGAPQPANPFTSVARDLKRFFSRDTVAVMGIFGPAASVAYPWDQAGTHESQEHLSRPVFEPGNVAGSFLVQTGAALGTWAIGKVSGHQKITAVGSDLFRAQIVSQLVVQAGKLTTGRRRPDGSDGRAFPSGHTASAFAMASVLDRHFGKKAGVAGYGFASYVALARLSANKHHLSDVIIGAGIGIAAGRTVTMGLHGATFDLGVAPTRGGAAVTFTKR